MNTQKLWQKVQEELRTTLSSSIYRTWFKNLSFKEKNETELILICPSPYAKETLEKNHYISILKNIAVHYFPGEYRIILEVKKIQKNTLNGPLFNQQAPLIVNDQNIILINRNYLFETFVIGPSNNLAMAAAKAIVENLGKTYNPFFIYGGVGLGKTHLICAIGNEILRKDPRKKVFYLSSEKFTNELILAIQKNHTSDFREKYRQADVLIIDDIQFFAGKEASQEEFFHTFNTLYAENRQIILSSDKAPREINKLEERLVSRFEGGLTVDIQTPDYETRMAILNSKCEEKQVQLSQEVIQYLAENVTENIRKLEGVLSQVITYSIFQKKEVTLNDVQKILGKREKNVVKKLSPDLILNTVCEYYGVKIKEVKGKSRKAKFVLPRQIIMYFLKKQLNVPLIQIGDYIGNRDHTTVMHAVEKIENLVEEKDSNIYQEIMVFKKNLLG